MMVLSIEAIINELAVIKNNFVFVYLGNPYKYFVYSSFSYL